MGDYDVDGSASTSLLVRFFKYIKHPHFYYIPDREKDGYGASKRLFEKLILDKPKLIILVDCGSTANEAIEFLIQNDIKSIIIDHHEINKPYPRSDIIINPKKNNGYIKYDYLCATALTYFFIDVLAKKIKSNYKLDSFLIYVLLASVCDVMPLRKINRIIAAKIINNFNINNNIAINSLYKLCGKNNKITIDDLAYFIGPIINSGGRLGKSNYGTELLSSDDPIIIKEKSNQLIKLNNQRKDIESLILDEINFKKIEDENKNVIIYYNPNINEGLIGIIAARLNDYFSKPSIVITNSYNCLKGSARSTINYNIGNLMKKLTDKNIITSGGGHHMAAGFSLKKSNIKILENFIINDHSNIVSNQNIYSNYDAEISSLAINKSFLSEIDKLKPFGNGNKLPIFYIKDLKIIKVSILKNKHISAILKLKNGSSIKSISFNSMNSKIGLCLLSYKKNISVIGEIYENIWNNKKTLQLNIKDILI